jgi:hypothetical protein
MVTLVNCQDYLEPPCRGWLEDAVCELGGSVAYLPQYRRPEGDITAPMTYRILVAAYVSDMVPTPELDPLLRSRTCDPPCGDRKRCVNRECVPAGPDDCEEPAKGEEPSPGKCLE